MSEQQQQRLQRRFTEALVEKAEKGEFSHQSFLPYFEHINYDTNNKRIQLLERMIKRLDQMYEAKQNQERREAIERIKNDIKKTLHDGCEYVTPPPPPPPPAWRPRYFRKQQINQKFLKSRINNHFSLENDPRNRTFYISSYKDEGFFGFGGTTHYDLTIVSTNADGMKTKKKFSNMPLKDMVQFMKR